MLRATDEAHARTQLHEQPHACGDTTFAPPLKRSHDERGLWFVFAGRCPRCQADREIRFLKSSPAPIPTRTPAPSLPPSTGPIRRITLPPPKPPSGPAEPRRTLEGAEPFIARGGEEERELYGSASEGPCTACDGAGEYFGVTGDYATGMVRCGHCGGTGLAR